MALSVSLYSKKMRDCHRWMKRRGLILLAEVSPPKSLSIVGWSALMILTISYLIV